MSSIEILHFFAGKVLVAILCGAIIGLERELKSKPAGIKTHILIAMGATIFTAASTMTATVIADTGHFGDPSRIAAQIVSGIGFIGGGAIIQARGTIMGLTTAASIWVVAAIGLLIGIGRAELAIAVSVAVVLVLKVSNWFEDRVLGRALTFSCEIVTEDPQGHVRLAINQALAQNNLLLDDFEMSMRGILNVLTCRYTGHRDENKKFILDLWNIPGIKEVRQI